MELTCVRYSARPDRAEENQRLIEDVFRELKEKAPKDVRYLVLRLSDGVFCHLVEDGARTISGLEAFSAFRTGGEDRRIGEPQQLQVTVVGSYRMLEDD